MEILTLKLAKELKGRKIKTIAYGYKGNAPYTHEFIIGDIINSWDAAFKRSYPDVDTSRFVQYDNFQGYWLSYMSESQINSCKNHLFLLDENGNGAGPSCHLDLNFFNEPTFTESDADREVYFELTD